MVAVLIGSLICVQPANARNLKQLRQKFAQASKDIRHLRGILHKVKKQQHIEANRLAVSEQNLRHTRSALKSVRTQYSSTRDKLSVAQRQLSAVRHRLALHNDLLSERIVDTYRHGSPSYLSVMLGAADMSDLLNRTYVVRKVVDKDNELIDQIKDDKRTVEKTKAAIETQERALGHLVAEKAHLEQEYNDEAYEHKQAVHDLQRQRVQEEGDLSELEHESSNFESMIRRMERTPQGRKRLAQAWHGTFLRPVPGRITSPFGMRYHPIIGRYKLHTGVDIACPIGTPVHAAGAGVVIVAGWYNAYGHAVLIDHGGGVTTLYGHQSRVIVRVGQSVTRGQVIGYSGNSGMSTGPHCHFEVRRHGRPVNPL
jgi:murein DD-endopeptidase MepM/ murein hydrolase activator NlpD